MTHQRFTIAGSTLTLLKAGEQGVVTRISSLDQTVVHQLRNMGIVPGAVVMLEQRSPQYVIQIGLHRLTLSPSTAQVIYLRLQPVPMTINGFDQLNQVAIAILKRFMTGQAKPPHPLSSPVSGR